MYLEILAENQVLRGNESRRGARTGSARGYGWEMMGERVVHRTLGLCPEKSSSLNF